MNYIIHTPSATRLKQEITKYVSEKISQNTDEMMLDIMFPNGQDEE